jgi:hypothetical protein
MPATSETRAAERQILLVGPYSVLGTGVVDAVAEDLGPASGLLSWVDALSRRVISTQFLPQVAEANSLTVAAHQFSATFHARFYVGFYSPLAINYIR